MTIHFSNYKQQYGYDVLTFKTDGGLELELFYKDGETHSIETEFGAIIDWKDKQTLSNLYVSFNKTMYTLLHVFNYGELCLPEIKKEYGYND